MIDEAHKFMDGVATDGLSNAIVDIARLMRHDGIRLVVSTQNPQALAPELLELSSLAVLHQFTSREWFEHLAHKIPLNRDTAFEKIVSLRQGEALVFAKRHRIASSNTSSVLSEEGSTSNDSVDRLKDSPYGINIFPISIRPRITCDLGASKTNLV